jgi:LPS-assembly protein
MILGAICVTVLLCCGAFAQELKTPEGVPVKIEADSLSYDNERDVYSAEGNVVITYGDGVLTAASVEYDRKNNLATAQGGAHLKMAEDSLQGDKIVVNVEDKTGVAYNSKVFYARNHFYIKGDRIEKTGENTYVIEKPVATTCDGDNPDWQVMGSNMKVTIEGYGVVTHARLLTGGVPVLYTPIIAFPAKTKRQTGFLLPYLAYSKDKDGVDIEVPFFWAINPQLDATLYSRYIEKRGYKQGAEFRYFLGSQSFGTFYGDFMEDNKHITETGDAGLPRDWQEMHRRWSYSINTETKFDSQFYVRTDLQHVSDAWYFRDFSAHNYYLTHFAASDEDPFRRVSFQGSESLRFLESSARLFKGWNNYNVIARVSSVDDFAQTNNDRTLQKYPEMILTGIRQPIFSTPVYFSFAGAYDYFYRREGSRGHYVDVAPTLSWPVNLSRFAILTPQITVRETYWSRDDEDSTADNRSGERTFYNAGFTLGSRFSRVFDTGFSGWDKVRHEVRPEILYSYSPSVRQDNLPDYLPGIGTFLEPFAPLAAAGANVCPEQNAAAWSLTQTLTARLKDKASASNYLEFFRLKLFQAYDINEAKKDMAGSAIERRPLSDFGIELDVKPHPYLFFAARNKYSIYNGWKEMNYDLGLSDWRGDKLTIGYRYTLDSVEEINAEIKAVITSRLSGRLAVRLDQFNDRKVENAIGFLYTEQCWSVGVDYVKTHDDERFMLKIGLTGLTMFGI